MERDTGIQMVLPSTLDEELFDSFFHAHDGVGLSECQFNVLLRDVITSWRTQRSSIITCSLRSVYT
jgi:hypothetical protein